MAEGDASGNGVINKSVNDVSGLMLVVTRSPAGLGEAVASPDVLSKNFTLSLSLPLSLSLSLTLQRLNRFRLRRSFDSLFSDTNKRILSFAASFYSLFYM